MTKDYEQLWNGVTCTTDEAQAVLALAEILADKEGRAFVSHLGGKDAELCIEILDDVSYKSHLPLSPPQTVSSGRRGIQPQTRTEAGLLRHAEKTRKILWTIAGFRDYN